MRIVITGANGFLGSAFVQRNALGAEIISIGRAPPGAPVVRHVVADLGKPSDLEGKIAASKLPDQADVVLHLAVSRLHRGFPETALDMFHVNVAATAALLDYARRAGVSQFVLGSTGTVYHPFPKAVHGEDDTTRPQSYFGLSKLVGEDFARLYAPKYFEVFVPRFFTPYGPGQSDRLIDGLIGRVREGKPVLVPLHGRGLTSAPIFLDDAVRVLENSIVERWSGVYNVAGEEVLSLEEMANAVGRATGRLPVIERNADASGATLVPDISRLRGRIDVSRFVPFEEGVRRTIAAMRAVG